MAVLEGLSSGGYGEGSTTLHVVGETAMGARAAGGRRWGIARGREIHGGRRRIERGRGGGQVSGSDENRRQRRGYASILKERRYRREREEKR